MFDLALGLGNFLTLAGFKIRSQASLLRTVNITVGGAVTHGKVPDTSVWAGLGCALIINAQTLFEIWSRVPLAD